MCTNIRIILQPFRDIRKFFVFRSPLFLVRVEGESGWPALIPGRRYLASSLVVPRVGEWTVFRNPKDKDQILVKRVAALQDNEYMMEGSVLWASSSKEFGPVPKELIIGTLLNTSIHRCIEVLERRFYGARD